MFQKLTTFCILLSLFACNPGSQQADQSTAILGETMGTFYEVKSTEGISDYKKGIDSVLVAVNQSFSTYIPESTISKINKNVNNQPLADRAFEQVFYKAYAIYKITEGAFDPAIMPVVNYWGFGPKGKKAVTNVDSQAVAELMKYSRFDSTFIKKNTKGVARLSKYHARTQLDFSAIAKGYGVDRVAAYLDEQNLDNYYVNIGGEVRGKGRKKDGSGWKIGINRPEAGSGLNEYELLVELKDLSMATSGNYRNFHEVNGQKYAHILDPKTGFPSKSDLLSATVFSRDCMEADAYATACMVMGFEKSRALIEAQTGLEAVLLFSVPGGKLMTYSSPGAPIVQ